MTPPQVSSSISLNVPQPVLQPNLTLLHISFSSMTLNLGDLNRVQLLQQESYAEQ